MRIRLFILGVILSFSATAQLQIWLSAPGGVGDSIYIAGDFNNWQPDAHLMQRKGEFFYTEINTNKTIEFKFTLGSWATAEVDEDGKPAANHRTPRGTDSVFVSVPAFSQFQEKSEVSPQVQLFDADFQLKPLGNSRSIYVYLPTSYHQTDGNYPVLYFNDGQNLFDDRRAFSGEWSVDEILDSLELEVIVVAIDHGGSKRIDEYGWHRNRRHGGGQGMLYLRSIIESLKPAIDEEFRTVAGREGTFMGGSSMGGLISLYAISQFPDTFGGALVFSPSLWFSRKVWKTLSKSSSQLDGKLYLLAGELEGNEGSVARDVLKLAELWRQHYPDYELKVKTDPAGEHAEWFWQREFPFAIQWLVN